MYTERERRRPDGGSKVSQRVGARLILARYLM